MYGRNDAFKFVRHHAGRMAPSFARLSGDIPFATSYSDPAGGQIVVRSGVIKDNKVITNIRANAVTLESCLTRDMLTSRGYPTSFWDFSHAREVSGPFEDAFGCFCHPVLGRRENPNCYLGPGIRSGCTDVPVTSNDPRWMKFLTAAIGVATFITPYVGPAISAAVGSLLNNLASGAVTMLGDTFASVVSDIEDIINKVLAEAQAFIGDVQTFMTDTFQKCNVSFKSLIDAIPSLGLPVNGIDPSLLSSYIGVREGLSIVKNTMMADIPSASTLVTMVDRGLEIDSLSSAMSYVDLRKQLVSVQNTVEGFAGRRSLDVASMEAFFNNPSNLTAVENMTAEALASTPLGGEGMAIASYVKDTLGGKGVSTWSSQAKDMIGSLDPAKIADLIPIDSIKADFLAKARDAIPFANAIMPAVQSSWQGYMTTVDMITGNLASGVIPSSWSVSYPGIVSPNTAKRTRRQILIDAKRRADDTVSAAVRATNGARVIRVSKPTRTADKFRIDTSGWPLIEKGVK